MNQNELLVRLTSADESERRDAREELHMLMNDEIARAYLDIIVSDAAEPARADAIVGLGPVIEEAGIDYLDDDVEFEESPELGPPVTREMFDEIVEKIRAIYTDESQPKLLRRRALEVLVRDPQDWLAQEIRKHYNSSDLDWKLTAVFAMGYITGFEDEIAATVRNAQEPILYEAVRAAGSMEVSAAAGRIRELAQSDTADRETRIVAIEALPFVDDDAEELLQELIGSDDEEIAEAAELALDELQAQEDAEELDED